MHDHLHNLAIHTNQLSFADLASVRSALTWYAQHVSHLHNIHLLQLRTRIPAHAMCIGAAETLYQDEYQTAHANLRQWKELLGLPQCNGWIHEGSERLELKSLCKQHHFDYLLTTKKVADKLLQNGYFWQRHQASIAHTFTNCVLVTFKPVSKTVPANNSLSNLVANC